MASIKLLVLSLVCLTAYGFPSGEDLFPRNRTIFRNTIFGDERLEGEIFEDVDIFDNIELTPRNVLSPYRLPTTTRPSHYNVLWIIDFTSTPRGTQSGTVSIQLYATQANVNEIVIHADDLDINLQNDVQLTLGATPIAIDTPVIESQYQFLRVPLANGTTLNYNAANPVIYTLTISFGADLRNDMYGIYRSWFRDDPTSTGVSWMASTQFQATASRYAFPCYDEPGFKATFDVTIRRPATHRSWFCTRLQETRPVANLTTYEDDVYHRTPVMSTYLLAIIVAQYASLETRNAAGQIMHEVIARNGSISDGQGDYAMDVGQRLLAEMSDHTGYDFYSQHPQLKMTQAAIPDFGAGAMENWGLLTYREAYLMYKEGQTNSQFKQVIAYILSHEIAHMWFGNLVTCDWWDVLWLNEGFARYYQYFLTYWIEDMGFETRFITEQVHTALLSDSSNNPQPLTNPGVGSPSSVSAMFSTISYNKGAAIIRMSEHLLGFEVARQGLRNYLRGKAFTNALPIELFEHQESAGIAAGALNYENFSYIDYYRSWTEQPGHPVLNVQVNHQTGEMIVYQRRFNINTGYSNVESNYIIPITFATASNPDFANTKPTHIISASTTIINRGSVGDEWVIFNKQQTGFYRVNYDTYTWDLIVLALRGNDRTRIHEFNRAQIVNDVFQFARSGLMSYRRALNILSFLENETDYAPWHAAIVGFNWLRNRLASSGTATELNRLNQLIARWGSTVMSTLTYTVTPGEPFMRSFLRYQLAPIMCGVGVQECLQAAQTQFAVLANNGEVAVDNRQWVYCYALRQGGAAQFNTLWQRFLTHNVYTEKILLLGVLGCTPDATSLNTFMTNIFADTQVIRAQDYSTAFNSAVTGNEGNTAIAFAFVRNNLDLVISAYRYSGSPATPLQAIGTRLRSEEAINEFLTWVNQNEATLTTSVANSARSSALSSRESNAWAVSIQTDLNEYLVGAADPVTTTTAAPQTPAPEVSTTQQPAINEPVTPNLPQPSSAVTKFLSVTALVFAVLINIIY